jgi:hypothetical protein
LPDLATLQTDMAAALLGGDPISASRAIEGEDAVLRLAVYRNTVSHGLCEALRLSYPATERVLGPDFFDQSALAFARGAPPRSPVLARYGAGFAEFLDSLPALADLPYLAWVARLDWAVDQAALASPGFAETGLSFMTESGPAKLRTATSLRVLHSPFSIFDLWQAIRDGEDDRLGDLDWRDGPHWLAIHRGGEGAQVTPLSSALGPLCVHLSRGEAFADAPDADPRALAAELLQAPFLRLDLDPPGEIS